MTTRVEHPFDHLFKTIQELVFCHSPSGAEQAIDQWLLSRLKTLQHDTWQDQAGNIIAKIPGKYPGAVAITAHKDEIGMLVKTVESNGQLRVKNLGGSYPWVYGEGIVDILGDRQTLSGILSFGSRHVSHESPQSQFQNDQALQWENVWIETKLEPKALEAAGIRPGSRVVVGRSRKQALRMGDHIASYTLDNKASIAILLELAQTLEEPTVDVYLVASAKEEVGAIGALYFTQRQQLDTLIALEIIPLAAEYPIEPGEAPVLLSQDNYGIYDEGLNAELAAAAKQAEIPFQWATLGRFGSDASIAMKFGHVARAACLGFPTDNTHGYEIAHLGAIANCTEILRTYLQL